MSLAPRFAMITLVAGIGVWAQAPAPAPVPAFTELRELLKLTDAQLTRLRQIQTQLAQNNRPINERIATRQQDLRAALDGGTNDPVAIGRQLLDIEQDRKEIDGAIRSAREAAVATLDGAQKETLKKLEEAAQLQVPIAQAQNLNLIPRTAAAQPFAGF